MTILEVLLLVPGLILALFGAYQVGLLLLSLAYNFLHRRDMLVTSPPSKRFVVIVPAHNEELLIGRTVDSILGSNYPRELLHLVVIADNCDDATASIVREHGGTCFERTDLEKRGKPYALDWTIRQLDLNAYDGLIIIDADTEIHREFLARMDAYLKRGHQALQGYFGVQNPDQNWLTRLALLPGTLKFKLHFPGKELVGLSCPLAGNGMCFDIGLIKKYGWHAFSITENWEYWVLLTLDGVRVGSAPEAIIYSQVAKSLKSGETQRMRWMRGRIGILLGYGGRLLRRGLLDFDPRKIDAVLELAKPSHAMYLAWSILYLAATAALWFWGGTGYWQFILAQAIVGSQLAFLILGFAIDRPPWRTWVALLMVPWYVAWKLVVSLKGLLGLRDRTWVRTKRHNS
jgi:1,2-diacylglycerol 3-beta-glucosyltransferase